VECWDLSWAQPQPHPLDSRAAVAHAAASGRRGVHVKTKASAYPARAVLASCACICHPRALQGRRQHVQDTLSLFFLASLQPPCPANRARPLHDVASGTADAEGQAHAGNAACRAGGGAPRLHKLLVAPGPVGAAARYQHHNQSINLHFTHYYYTTRTRRHTGLRRLSCRRHVFRTTVVALLAPGCRSLQHGVGPLLVVGMAAHRLHRLCPLLVRCRHILACDLPLS
jgi:hypothetical protein